jgi:hypothetical protein
MPTGTLHTEPKFRNALLQMDGIASEFETGTCSSDAVTINSYVGLITTESKTTAQDGVVTITLTNDKIDTDDFLLVTLHNGTNTGGSPVLGVVTISAGEAVITFHNKHASAEAFDGTLLLGFAVIKKVSGL